MTEPADPEPASASASARASAPGHCTSCGRLLAECPGCRRTLDPPRFCAECGTRLAVAVHPTGWTARCKHHGDLAPA